MVNQPGQRAAEGYNERYRQAHTESHIDSSGYAEVGTYAEKLRQNKVVD
jgi:hypothetical protein